MSSPNDPKIPETVSKEGEVEPEKQESKKELLKAAKKLVDRRVWKKKEEKFDWSSQGALVLGGILFLSIVLYAILGMQRHKTSRDRPVTEASALPGQIQYGGESLPGKTFVGMEAIRTEKNADLVDEIKKVIAEKAMPNDVFQNDVPPERNVANGLSREFRIYKQNPGELEQLRKEVPYDSWHISKETLSKVADVLERVEPKRFEIRKMLDRKDVCFAFEFVHDPEFGDIPDTEASDYLSDYALLEEYAIARALDAGKIEDATESLAYIYRLAQLAAEVKNPGIRSKAAQIRLHTLDVLQTVVLDPKCQKSDLAYLYKMLDEQLDAWTPDAEAWIGDRASGMKVYNMILQYGLEAGLEPDEVTEMKTRGYFDRVNQNLLTHLPGDQIFYLKSMQSIIDSCQKPFYQRITLLNQITNEVRMAQGTNSETIIAEFLLRGVRELMQYSAQDRTKCEMATLAIAISLKNAPDVLDPSMTKKSIETLTVDQLYGKNYEVRQVRDENLNLVWVSYHGNLKPFRVPDHSKSEGLK